MKRHCSMCGQRKPEFMPLAGGWGCRDCCSSAGMSAPRNVAKQNSAKWQKEPCKHQSTQNLLIKRHNTEYLRTVCRRCKAIVVNDYPIGHHGKRR